MSGGKRRTKGLTVLFAGSPRRFYFQLFFFGEAGLEFIPRLLLLVSTGDVVQGVEQVCSYFLWVAFHVFLWTRCLPLCL
jgi:hypothetical protein